LSEDKMMKVLRYLVGALVNAMMLYNSVAIADQPLDLDDLENRLRETEAIGLFSKLWLKGEVEGLIDEFRAFHEGESSEGLETLRQRYAGLLDETLALLESGDPELRQAISQSRAKLWAALTNPAEFATL
jgi:hypothetical protein